MVYPKVFLRNPVAGISSTVHLLEDEAVVAPGGVRVVAGGVPQDVPQKLGSHPVQRLEAFPGKAIKRI